MNVCMYVSVNEEPRFQKQGLVYWKSCKILHAVDGIKHSDITLK